MERSLEELERAIADGKFLSWASDYLLTWGSTNYTALHEFSHPFDDFGGHFSLLNHADPTVLAGLLLGVPLLLLAVGKHLIGYDDEPDNYYGYDSHPQYYNDEILNGAYQAEDDHDNYNTNHDKKGFLHNKFDNIVNRHETIFNLNLLNRIVSHMKNRMKIFPTAEEEKKSYYNAYNTHGHDPYEYTNSYDINGNKQHPYEPPNTYNVDQNINHYEDPPNTYNMNKPYSYEAPNAYNVNENIHHYEEPPNTYNMKGNAHQYGDPNEYNVNENKNSYDDRNTYNSYDNKRYNYQDVNTYNRNRNTHHEDLNRPTYNRNKNTHHEDLNTYNRNKNTHHEDPHYTRRKPQQHPYDDQNGYMESMGIEYNLYEVGNSQKEPYKGQKDYIHGFMDEPKNPNKDFFHPDEDFYGVKESEPVKKVKNTKIPKTPTSYNRSQRKGLNRPTSKLAKTVSTQIQIGNNANQS